MALHNQVAGQESRGKISASSGQPEGQGLDGGQLDIQRQLLRRREQGGGAGRAVEPGDVIVALQYEWRAIVILLERRIGRQRRPEGCVRG